MHLRTSSIGLLAVGAAAAFAFLSLVQPAQGEPPAAEHVAGIKDIMNAVNHKGFGLFGMVRKDLRQDGIDADGWKLIQARAAVMAEAANVLLTLDPPRGGIDSWYQQISEYRNEAKALRKWASMNNLEKARAAGDALNARCDSCHSAHQSE